MVSFRYTAGTILIVPIIMKNYASVEWQLWKNFFHCNYFELVVTLTGNCGTLRYVSVLSFISNRARLLSYWLKCWFIFQTFYLKGINIWMTIFQNDARRKKNVSLRWWIVTIVDGLNLLWQSFHNIYITRSFCCIPEN